MCRFVTPKKDDRNENVIISKQINKFFFDKKI